MRGVFDEEDLEQVRPRRDTELTLGSGTLLATFFGLVLLCGLCFGLGYALGHRGAQNSTAVAPGADAPQPAGASLAKPSASSQTPATSAADTGTAPSATYTPQDSALPVGASPAAVPQAAPPGQYAGQATAQPAANSGQTQVHPAMASGNAVASAVQPYGTVRPALQPAGSFVVQIAAVSNQEDADVLSNALRRRGYAVSAKREPVDNLIHVRIGPFATAAEANSWKNRLLNDGYNAIVQQ